MCFILILICGPSYFTASASEQINLLEKYNYNPQEETKEILYNDIIMAMLTPYIDSAVEKYYGTHYLVAPWANKIIIIERPNGDRTSYFIIEI
jgi:CTP:phosphocholine cytidylyltransferase-like protein